MLGPPGGDMISKLLKMQLLDEEDELAYSSSGDGGEDKEQREADGRPTWMRTLANSLYNWSNMVPKVMHAHPHSLYAMIMLSVELWLLSLINLWQEKSSQQCCH